MSQEQEKKYKGFAGIQTRLDDLLLNLDRIPEDSISASEEEAKSQKREKLKDKIKQQTHISEETASKSEKPSTESYQVYQQETITTKKKDFSALIRFGIIGAIALLCIIAGLLLFSSLKKSKDKSVPDINTQKIEKITKFDPKQDDNQTKEENDGNTSLFLKDKEQIKPEEDKKLTENQEDKFEKEQEQKSGLLSRFRQPPKKQLSGIEKINYMINEAMQTNDKDKQFEIAMAYFKGIEISKDLEKAKYWLTLAANNNNQKAQVALGELYLTGLYFPVNYTSAEKYFRMAAENGDREAQFQLGLIYFQAKDVKLDYKEAKTWLELSARQEHPGAQYHLGRIYEKGLGIKTDSEMAIKWYKKAAENNHPDALYQLGIMHQIGIGIELDVEKGNKLIERAANLGHIEAQKELERIKRHN